MNIVMFVIENTSQYLLVLYYPYIRMNASIISSDTEKIGYKFLPVKFTFSCSLPVLLSFTFTFLKSGISAAFPASGSAIPAEEKGIELERYRGKEG